MGGLAVMLGFYLGVSLLIIVAVSLPPSVFYASLAASLGAGFVGLIDDMFGLRQRAKAVLPFLLAIPLGAVAYSSGDTYLLGVNLGLLTVDLVILAFLQGSVGGLFIAFPLLGALVAFLAFNKYPARVFPGDSMTLFMGAAIASIAIVAHQKTIGAILFAPMIVEFGLKLRSHFHAENYGTPDDAGRLHHTGQISSLTHFIMHKRPLKEWQIVAALWCLEGCVSLLVVALVVIQ